MGLSRSGSLACAGIAAVGVALAACSSSRQPLTIRAEMVVRDRGRSIVGFPCTEEAGLRLIIAGSNGSTLAKPQLIPGKWERIDEPQGAVACTLEFEAHLPPSYSYQFRVNNSRPLRFLYDDLKRQAAMLQFFNPEQSFNPDSYVRPSP